MDVHELVGRLAAGEGVTQEDRDSMMAGVRFQTQVVLAQQVVLENGWRATAQQVQAALWEKCRHAASVEECREAMASLQEIEGFQERFESRWGTLDDFIQEANKGNVRQQQELFA